MSAKIEEPEMPLFDDEQAGKLRANLNKVAEFVALYETAEEKLKTREQAIETRIFASEQRVSEQLSQIQAVLNEFQIIMTEAGAARWRVAAEQALNAGEEHLKSIRYATHEFVKQTQETYAKLDKVAGSSVQGISKAIQTFKVDEFQHVAKDSIKLIKQSCNGTMRKVNDVIRWFHWRNLGMVLSVTLVVTMITGLYLNDEWPWETHREVMQQRSLAQAVISAWPHLTRTDQQEILHSVNKHIA